jgi:hypothetical protein
MAAAAMVNTVVEVEMQQPKLLIIEVFESRLCSGPDGGGCCGEHGGGGGGSNSPDY